MFFGRLLKDLVFIINFYLCVYIYIVRKGWFQLEILLIKFFNILCDTKKPNKLSSLENRIQHVQDNKFYAFHLPGHTI